MKKNTETKEEMIKLLADNREKLRAMTFQGVMSKEKDVRAKRKAKKAIARALTGLGQ